MPNTRCVRGNSPLLCIAFEDRDGLPVDPVTLRFRVITPEGTRREYTYGPDPEIVRDAAGEYHCAVLLDTVRLRAKYYCRWEAVDALGLTAADERIIETISDFKEI